MILSRGLAIFMKNKKESFLKGILFLLVSQVFIKIVGLIYKLYLTNKEGFGDNGNAIYSSGFQIYALLLTFSSTGVPNAISKLVSSRLAVGDNKGANRVFKIAFVSFAIIGCIGSILLFMGAKTVARNWIQIPEAEYSLICLSPSIFFVSITAVIRGYFNGRLSFSATAKSQSLEQIFKTVFTIGLVELVVFLGKKDTKIMAAAANLATTVATISSFIYIYLYYKLKRKEIASEIAASINYKPTRIRKTIKEILTVAMPISISSLISSFNKNIDSFTIVRYLKLITTEENAKIQYGILSGKVDSLCILPVSLNSVFVTALVPNISSSIAKGDIDAASKKANLFILVSILIAMPITAIMFMFSGEILKLLFPNAQNGAIYLKYSSLSIIFMILAQTINGILQGIGKVNVPAISFGIGMIIKFICNIVLIPNERIGIFGAIIGTFLCNVVAFIISFVILNKNLRLRFKFKKFIFKPIIATILMYFIITFLYKNMNSINIGNIAIILTFFAGCISYIFMIFAFKTISREEFKLLRKV